MWRSSRRTVASVTVLPSGGQSLLAGTTVPLVATARSASNADVTPSTTVAWTSSNTTVARVSESGVVTAVAPGTATITAWRNGQEGTASNSVPAFAFRSVATASGHSCGPTTLGPAWCWGASQKGQLDNGISDGYGLSNALTPVAVLRGLTFKAVVTGINTTCALAEAGAAYCWGRNLCGGLGDGTTTDRWIPVAVQHP